MITLANTFLGAAALCWLGLWFGLKARTQAAAIVWSVGLAKGLPSLVSLLGVFAGQIAWGPLGRPRGLLWLLEYVPELLNTALFLALIGVARHRLLTTLAGAEPLPFNAANSTLGAWRALVELANRWRKIPA